MSIPITCDQVAGLTAAIERYLPKDNLPQISRLREMKIYGMLYEIMEIADLIFADDAARGNGTPKDALKKTNAINYAASAGQYSAVDIGNKL